MLDRPPPKLRFIKHQKLKEHEGSDPILVEQLLERIRSDGFLKRPLSVDANTHVILDGHARFNCLKRLGCDIIPVYLFDYKLPEIVLDSYRDDIKISKEDIIRAGLIANKFPPKTSKHLVRLESGKLVHISNLGKDARIPLKRLQVFDNKKEER